MRQQTCTCLLAKAAEALGVAGADAATTGNVTIVAADGRSLADGEIAAAVSLHVEALPNAPLRQKRQFRTMGFNLPRLDIPAKTTGGKAFIQDMRLPGMLHARVIRGPSIGTRLELSPDTEIEAMDGVIKFVRNGDFAAVVSRRVNRSLVRVGVAERRSVDYLDTQSGDVRRQAAELLNSPIETIRAIHVEGAGCYEHNGADDVGAEAALIAAWIPGKPIRLQWMRDQEFSWEPLGLGMVTEGEAAVDAGDRIVKWNYDVWSNPHNNRPVVAGGILVGNEVSQPFPLPEGKPIPMPEGGGSRNSNAL